MSSTPPKTIPKPSGALESFLFRMSNKQKGLTKNGVVAELKAKIELKEKEMLNCSSRLSNTQSEVFKDTLRSSKDYNYGLKSLQEVDLLLIGKTGNGKSSLGNTILGKNAFVSKSSLKSVTEVVTYDVCEYNGYKIKVMDGPGVADTRPDVKEATQLILKATSEAISLNPQGFHAFLLVVKFGGRFTEEDKITVDTLKKIFGEHFFKKFCILVMTCGDKFEEEADTSFQEWVKEQDLDIFKDLLKECNDRIVLFNNKTQNEEKKKKQLNELFEVIESLKRQNCRYTDEHFNTALETRNVLLVESKKEIIEEGIMDEANFIQQRFELILDIITFQKSAPFLHELYQRAEDLYKKIFDSDMNTGVLKNVSQHVWSIMNAIRDQITILDNFVEETAKLQKEKEEQARLHAKESRRQTEEIDKLCQEGKTQDKFIIDMLQKQFEQMNEVTKKWDAKEKELEANAKTKWENEKKIALIFAKEFQKLKEEQTETKKSKISKGVFTKLKHKLFGKKQ